MHNKDRQQKWANRFIAPSTKGMSFPKYSKYFITMIFTQFIEATDVSLLVDLPQLFCTAINKEWSPHASKWHSFLTLNTLVFKRPCYKVFSTSNRAAWQYMKSRDETKYSTEFQRSWNSHSRPQLIAGDPKLWHTSYCSFVCELSRKTSVLWTSKSFIAKVPFSLTDR